MGGVAILAPSTVQVTAPPALEHHVLWDGRMIAGHVHWGTKGGIVVVNVYMDVEQGLEGSFPTSGRAGKVRHAGWSTLSTLTSKTKTFVAVY